MTERTVRAIVLRRRDSGEADRRLTLLSREEGRLDVVAKGARKPSSRLSGCSEPLTLSMMHLAEGRHTCFLTQSQTETSFPGLRLDYERLSAALAMAELHACVAQAGNVSEEAFDLLELTLRSLEHHANPVVVAVWAQVKLLELEGLQPSWTVCPLTERRLAETPAWVSPEAGGYIDPDIANDYADRFLVGAEALIGLSRIGNLEMPPSNLKHAEECLRALASFWRVSAHASLPATDAFLSMLDHQQSSE